MPPITGDRKRRYSRYPDTPTPRFPHLPLISDAHSAFAIKSEGKSRSRERREKERAREHFPFGLCNLGKAPVVSLALVSFCRRRGGLILNPPPLCHYGKWNGYIANAPAHNKVGNKSKAWILLAGRGVRKRGENSVATAWQKSNQNAIKYPKCSALSFSLFGLGANSKWIICN